MDGWIDQVGQQMGWWMVRKRSGGWDWDWDWGRGLHHCAMKRQSLRYQCTVPSQHSTLMLTHMFAWCEWSLWVVKRDGCRGLLLDRENEDCRERISTFL